MSTEGIKSFYFSKISLKIQHSVADPGSVVRGDGRPRFRRLAPKIFSVKCSQIEKIKYFGENRGRAESPPPLDSPLYITT